MGEEYGSAMQHALKEIARQRALVDQGLSMQARLRDRDFIVGTLLVCSVLLASLGGVAFAFAGTGSSVTLFGVKAARATWLGTLAVLTAAVALIELVVDRRGAAQRRAEAVRMLAALKAEYRSPPRPGNEVAEAARLSERYALAMDSVPPIPERSFNRLKAGHLRKVEISKWLSKHPGASYWRGRRAVIKAARKAPAPPTSKLPKGGGES